MKLNITLTIRLILAMLVVSGAYLFGIKNEQRIELDSCGYAIIKEKFVEVYSSCLVTVKIGAIPMIETEKNMIQMTMPKGWKWRIVV